MLNQEIKNRQELLNLVDEIRKHCDELRNLRAADAQEIKALRTENTRLRSILASHGIAVEP